MAGEREICDRVTASGRDRLQVVEESLALGLLGVRKWDKIYSWQKSNNTNTVPTSVHEQIGDSFTDSEIADFRETARRMLREYVAVYIDIKLDRSERWWRGFGQGVAAAFAYSLAIVAIALIIKVLGSDVATVFKFLTSH